jgi:hypothetical protein
LTNDSTVMFSHRWIQSREHNFPLNHPFPPAGHEEIKQAWASLTSQNPDRWRQYLYHTAVDTNHVESTFFISNDVSRSYFNWSTMSLTSNKSIRDIIRRGIDGAYINPLQKSPLHDPAVIRNIIKDTVSVRFVLPPYSPRTSYRVAVGI